jgi:glucan biosynthesis protein
LVSARILAVKSRNVELGKGVDTYVNVAVRRNQIASGRRVGFEYRPELGYPDTGPRRALAVRWQPVSEVWLYRRTA